MGQAKLLDCTLRDGAYLIDKTFGDQVILGIISGLVEAKVDYIEIGFLQDDGFGPGKTVFKNAEDAKRFIPSDKGGCLFTVLADCSRYSIDNLEQNPGGTIDCVRECFFKHERDQAMKNCIRIKDKGYRVFVQPVDILGYTDAELLELIEMVNRIEPDTFSIVDTFGSMYEEDLQHVYSVINHNLIPSCKIGFHSHNNMQMSSALSQAFIRMANGKREVVVDGTISGMGRGAGNTPTELVAQYMIAKLGYSYNMDALLDIIDTYMDNIRSRCTWGYSTPLFLCGCYSAHVNNVSYLAKKSSIRSKEIRYILNKMGASERKRYPYDLIERTYLEYLNADIDDSNAIEALKKELGGKTVVVIAPGWTATDQRERILQYIRETSAVAISVNFVHDAIPCDYVYISNSKRYHYWENDTRFISAKKIITSNIAVNLNEGDMVVSFARLVKCGWEHLDNSTILLLRLLDELGVSNIGLAGFDGYSSKDDGSLNYVSRYLELSNVKENPMELNLEIADMLADFLQTKKNSSVQFITESRFKHVLENHNG